MVGVISKLFSQLFFSARTLTQWLFSALTHLLGTRRVLGTGQTQPWVRSLSPAWNASPFLAPAEKHIHRDVGVVGKCTGKGGVTQATLGLCALIY